MHRQEGQALALALVALALGALMVGPLLSQATTSLLASEPLLPRLAASYSSEAGVQHGLWRLQYEAGFASSISPSSPTQSYSITINGVEVPVTVTWVEVTPPPPEPPPTPEGSQGWRIAVGKEVEPASITPGQYTVFTYTILIQNVGTSQIALDEIGDTLPAGFVYEPGSASGITTAEPSISGQDLVWSFSSPKPKVGGGELRTLSFRASATPQQGFYYNTAWVTCAPESVGTIYSGSASPVTAAWPHYDVVASYGGTTVKARVNLPDGVITILSWQVE